MGKESKGPRNEVNTSDGLETVMKFEDSIQAYLDPGFFSPPVGSLCHSPDESQKDETGTDHDCKNSSLF